MLKKLFTTAAAGALLVSATAVPTAFAQDTTAPAPAAPETPAVTEPAMPDASGGTTATAPSTEAAPMTSATYLPEQAPDQISANTYIGQTVYNAADENVGEISDLIMEKDGGIVAAVVGVGGFLGLGQKDVAVPIDNIAVAQDPTDGTLKLTTTESAETLKAAPEFKTLAMVQSEKDSANQPTGSITPNSTTTAPAEPQ
ncbi:PRC-barrel domain-containing protein [Rhizobiaceae bacterium n13]|uniref:PRC-barrel domain-containing protein n=1 Tax=Ferirhizobium litorale TaxID=2927786 RepID=A0AAE3U2T6_9HYPH|nr:PRC-barrel domain-containing protein [Fererhizobium litorale]MDI7861527.1 PRC-barrel domain-containing protein [Fererhizobium litorale]MDI7921673.1 PRC-barrel domain-containing protein [Fererhizobium litorale]